MVESGDHIYGSILEDLSINTCTIGNSCEVIKREILPFSCGTKFQCQRLVQDVDGCAHKVIRRGEFWCSSVGVNERLVLQMHVTVTDDHVEHRRWEKSITSSS